MSLKYDCRGMESVTESYRGSESTVDWNENAASEVTSNFNHEIEESSNVTNMNSASAISKQRKVGITAAVSRTGAAELSPDGHLIGMNTIYSRSVSYMFLLFLPGLDRTPTARVICKVMTCGMIKISGVIAATSAQINFNVSGDAAQESMKLFPGPFSLTFCLPGPVLPRSFKVTSFRDGLLEALILKNDTIEDSMITEA
ncbi:increased DNA methylation 3-like isoform X2 [Typha latifolia]|uniref:increased DNA methylation 3-like isoform X2 n=1 Tax=Typha latifolia TaxID=4733 RepID=UPI003C2B33AF